MNIYYISALTAALTWAITPLINTIVVRHTGVITAVRWKVAFASSILWAMVAYNGTISSISNVSTLSIAALSGIIGVFIGDTALYGAIKHLGGRRVTVLYTLATPFVMILGVIFLGENLTFKSISACAIILTGVVVVILNKDNAGSSKSTLDTITGSLKIGVFWAILAALGQAVGIVMARPILEQGIDPVAFSAVRLSAALVPIFILRFAFPKHTQTENPMLILHYWYLFLIALLGLGIGMTLTMFALSGGKAGIVTTLTSTAPIFALPIIWMQTKNMPTLGAWIGAILVVLGTALLSL